MRHKYASNSITAVCFIFLFRVKLFGRMYCAHHMQLLVNANKHQLMKNDLVCISWKAFKLFSGSLPLALDWLLQLNDLIFLLF